MGRAQRGLFAIWALAVVGPVQAESAAPVIPSVGATTSPSPAPAGQVPNASVTPAPADDAPPGTKQMTVPAGSAEEIELGRRIYRDGIGAKGKPITGVRFGGIEAQGTALACVNCHRRSGLGAIEGTDQVPPVAGRFLFADDPRALVTMNARNLKSFNQRHEPYTLASFAEVLGNGKHVSGRELGPIMPRYQFTDTEIKALAVYQRGLSAQWSPGVTGDRIRFATVITPEVDPARRKAFIDTIKAAVGQKNGNVVAHGQRTMSAAEMLLHTERRWDLDIWELQGPADTWAEQLDQRYQAQPVFALISGLGDSTWAPIHEFCERQQLACWFPSVDLAPDRAKDDFYSLYFSRGVTLEADVLAHYLRASKSRPRRLVQIHRADEAGRSAAQNLRARLTGGKNAIKVEDRAVSPDDAGAWTQALSKLGKQDVLMLWLQPGDLAKLPATPPPAGSIYVSAYLANGEQAPLPPAWKKQVRLVYPFQLPDKRATGLLYFHSWLSIRKLALIDEIMQSEVYFALTYLSETLMEMLDNLHREYLIERAESMLSLRESAKAEDEAREMSIAKHQVRGGAQAAMARMNAPEIKRIPRPMPGRQEHVFAKRESTTIYPRLGLSQGQRFASKGAYIVRFADEQGTALVPESDWIVP